MEFRLSTGEIAGIVLSSVYAIFLVGIAAADSNDTYVLWYLPNLAFALGVAIVVRRFRRQNRSLPFKTAALVTFLGLCVTSALSIALYSSFFHLPLSRIDLAGFYDGYLAVYIVPVVCMFPLGAADRDAERLLVGGLLLFNAIHFSNQYDVVFDQFRWLGFCLLGSVLGYPLAVLGTRS